MRVILLQDVAKIGKKGDVKEVNQGHANNFLIPRKLVRPATDKDVVAAKRLQEERKVKEQVKGELLVKTLSQLNGKKIEIKEKANEKGSLFSQVHKEEIIKSIKDTLNVDVDESWILLENPIKEVGDFDIKIQKEKASATLTLTISSN